MFKTDTITAIATALSDSGIGIVRVSGDEALQIVNKIFRNKFEQRFPAADNLTGVTVFCSAASLSCKFSSSSPSNIILPARG